MLRALLVDDEPKNLDGLEFLLHHDCDGITATGKVKSAEEARNFLKSNQVDVIFLDISMPGEDGFELLKTIDTSRIKVVFVTAHNEYTMQAIKASAVDYLLKPVRIDELQNAVEKIKLSIGNPYAKEQNHTLIQHFLDLVNQGKPVQKIALPQLGSIRFIALDEIIALQADSNYTIIHLKNMQKLVISKTLKDFEDLLDETQFARIHKSYIVNLRYINEYSTIDGGVVKMCDGSQWSISRRQLESFLEKMKKASLMFDKLK
jgi:two-component system LytT family response regulator